MDSPPARIVVELTPGAVPITGNVLASAQESRPFTGWIGLFAALRAAAGAGITADSLDGGNAAQVVDDEARHALAPRGRCEVGAKSRTTKPGEPTSRVKRSLNATDEPTTHDS
jgi:hypothetical protein